MNRTSPVSMFTTVAGSVAPVHVDVGAGLARIVITPGSAGARLHTGSGSRTPQEGTSVSSSSVT